jgi:hypothetical protein
MRAVCAAAAALVGAAHALLPAPVLRSRAHLQACYSRSAAAARRPAAATMASDMGADIETALKAIFPPAEVC